MAKTAVVNPRKKRRRRRTNNPRRRSAAPRRRRRYGSRRARSHNAPRRRRRRNPGAPITSTYSAGGYRRTPNPDLFDFDHIMAIAPAAVGGDFAARWAVKIAGPMESDRPGGKPVPGFKHALAGVLAARMGSSMIGSLLGDASKAHIAEIAAIAFTGSLFARKRFLAESKWITENLYLDGYDDEGDEYDAEIDTLYSEDMSGFESESALGVQLVQDANGNVYALEGVAPDAAGLPTNTRGGLGSFETQSALGNARPSASSSFGYT